MKARARWEPLNAGSSQSLSETEVIALWLEAYPGNVGGVGIWRRVVRNLTGPVVFYLAVNKKRCPS